MPKSRAHYTYTVFSQDGYERFAERLLAGQRITVLYFGDHDPSGLDMVRDIRERLTFMFKNGDYEYRFEENGIDVDEAFKVLHIGLTKQQIRQYNPPPNPTKLTDSRANKYIAIHGQTCWEIDALNPQTLTAIVETNIQREIDIDIFEEMLEKQAEDIAIIKKKFKL